MLHLAHAMDGSLEDSAPLALGAGFVAHWRTARPLAALTLNSLCRRCEQEKGNSTQLLSSLSVGAVVDQVASSMGGGREPASHEATMVMGRKNSGC